MDNDNNQNPDAPLKAFATFWVGLAAFVAFGVIGLAAYKLSGGGDDAYYDQEMERRSEIRSLIDAEQATEMSKINFDAKKAAADFGAGAEFASQKPAPGTPSHAKMMKEQMAAAKAASDKKKAEEDAANPPKTGGEAEVAVQKITLTPIANVMKFEQATLTAKTGAPIELTFNNTDVLMHNVLILKPGTKDAVGALADASIADPDGMAKGYIPESTDILAHTKLLMAGQSETIKFTLDTPGEYPYICTFPGHWRIMQGVLTVEKGDAPEAATAPPAPSPEVTKGQDLELTPIANVMKFEQVELKAKAGAPINLTFSNTDVLMHNVLILKPGTKDKVGALADAGIADPEGMAKGYIPESSDIIAHTKLLQAGQSETITFTLDAPGEYPYICTFPGHWRIMQGTLIVE